MRNAAHARSGVERECVNTRTTWYSIPNDPRTLRISASALAQILGPKDSAVSIFAQLFNYGAEFDTFPVWRVLLDIAKKDCSRASRAFASLPTSWLVATADGNDTIGSLSFFFEKDFLGHGCFVSPTFVSRRRRLSSFGYSVRTYSWPSLGQAPSR